MLKGTTRSCFAFEIPDARCRNMELVDALAAVDHGNLNEKALYDHLRAADGTVPIEAVIAELSDIFNTNQEGKNSSSSPE